MAAARSASGIFREAFRGQPHDNFFNFSSGVGSKTMPPPSSNQRIEIVNATASELRTYRQRRDDVTAYRRSAALISGQG
jgi:hypothetical protein